MAKRKRLVKRSTSRGRVGRHITRAAKFARTPIQFNRTNLVVGKLKTFAVLLLVSVIVTSATNDELLDQFFGIIGVISAFVVVALLIVLLIEWFYKKMKN